MSKPYCIWALLDIRNYYNQLLTIEKDNPWINLRLPNGQIPWVKKEIEQWIKIKEEYS